MFPKNILQFYNSDWLAFFSLYEEATFFHKDYFDWNAAQNVSARLGLRKVVGCPKSLKTWNPGCLSYKFGAKTIISWLSEGKTKSPGATGTARVQPCVTWSLLTYVFSQIFKSVRWKFKWGQFFNGILVIMALGEGQYVSKKISCSFKIHFNSKSANTGTYLETVH